MSDTNPPADHAFVDEKKTGTPIEENLKSRATWKRFLFMLISCILISLASIVGSFIVVFGFLWLLFTGEVNRELRGVGQSLATYIYENIRFLTFNTDDRPFPFGGKWPDSGTEEE
ncbi:MAG: DUF4389 domain-containing protein [Chromatiales bacterium]|nr:MAG: DUF4389 domain-containing protein [Chromatiales bacterium]